MAATIIWAYCTDETGVEKKVWIENLVEPDRKKHYYIRENGIVITVIPVLKGTRHFRHKRGARSEYVRGGGPMSDAHIESENEMYFRAKEVEVKVIISDQVCPMKAFGCPKYDSNKCIAKVRTTGPLNISKYYPVAVLEPNRELDNKHRSDIQLLNAAHTAEVAIEIKYKNGDSLEKQEMGIPTIGIMANKKWIVEHPVLNCVSNNGKCWGYNLWALTFMLTQFPCDNIRQQFIAASVNKATEKPKNVKLINTSTDDKDETYKEQKHGMTSQDVWIEPESKYKGEPFDYVWRKDRVHVLEIRNKRPYLCVLTAHTRELYKLPPTELEKCLDHCIHELDMIVDMKPYKGKTVSEIAKINYRYVTDFMQNRSDHWSYKFSKECIKYIEEMRGLGKVYL